MHIYMVLLCNMGCYINRQFAHFQLSKILKLYVIQELFPFNECKMVPPLSCKFSICYRIILDCFSRFKYLYLQMKIVYSNLFSFPFPKGIKMYNFIIKSIIFKMSIYLYYVMLFTIHVEYILYPHSQSGGYTGIPLSVRPSLSIVYVTSYLSFVGFYSYLVSWLAMIWACAYYTNFTDAWF